MFKLFERRPNWALKQLVEETDQPVVSLLLKVPDDVLWVLVWVNG